MGDDHKDVFCFKRKREERMVKEWANKDKYHPSSGVLEPRVHMPRAKACVRTVSSWGERKAAGGAAVQTYTGQISAPHRSDQCMSGQAELWVSCSYRC
jgi:hypothetical protein